GGSQGTTSCSACFTCALLGSPGWKDSLSLAGQLRSSGKSRTTVAAMAGENCCFATTGAQKYLPRRGVVIYSRCLASKKKWRTTLNNSEYSFCLNHEVRMTIGIA